MKNKYYTPEIEEFCVGFECEIQSSWGMQKGIYPSILREDTLTGFQLQKIGETETLKKVISGIRVKYLDKEDIESLGFKDYKKAVCDWYKLEGHFEDSFASYGYWTKIRLIHCALNNKIKILAYEYTWDEKETVLFAGTIKNKSEFKKLLRQLNIN